MAGPGAEALLLSSTTPWETSQRNPLPGRVYTAPSGLAAETMVENGENWPCLDPTFVVQGKPFQLFK